MGVYVHQIDIERSPYHYANLKAYRQIKRLIRKEKISAIHCHTPMGGALSRLAGRACGVAPIIYSCHGFHFDQKQKKPFDRIYKAVERYLAKFTDCIITINEEDYCIAKSFKKRSEHVYKIPGVGLDVKAMHSSTAMSIRNYYGISEDAFVILFVGDLTAGKDPITALHAFFDANIPNSYLLFCGTGPLRMLVEKECKEAGIEDRTLLCGYCKDMASYYQAADVLLFPTRREGFGMAGVEAMSFGLPVVASNIRGITEYSVDGETGFLCEPGDVEAFSSALVELYRDTEKARIIGCHNIRISTEFEISRVAAKMKNIYKIILSR